MICQHMLIPGHPFVLHEGLSIEEPGQGLPPFAGDGLVQDLDLDLVPPPHVTVHDVQLLQLLYPPFTVQT